MEREFPRNAEFLGVGEERKEREKEEATGRGQGSSFKRECRERAQKLL